MPELQSLRGIAACIVVIGHCISYFEAPDWYDLVKRLVNTQASVEIFFVLSGFVLALSLKRRGFGKVALGAYYVRRLFRIYPALILASALALSYVALLHYRIPGPHDSVWITERFRADRYTPLHIAASFAGMLAYLIPPVWTIFVEIVNSVLLPPVAWLATRLERGFGLVVAALAALGVILGGSLYYHLDLYFFNFALGVALTLPLPRVIAFCRRLPLKTIVGLAALLLLITRAFVVVPIYDPWMNLYETVLAAAIIFALGRLGVEIAALQGRFIEWIGDISFSIYLLHFPIMMYFSKAIYVFTPGLVDAIGPIAAGFVLLVLTMATTIAAAGLSYRFVELNGIKLGNRLLVALGLGRVKAPAQVQIT
ncbi:hypothetical protein BZG35_05600 [Brevundimonas sp. LM2]|nr:hypothetical protein BZG35_05600 [Brevundimonas sp. LM2]